MRILSLLPGLLVAIAAQSDAVMVKMISGWPDPNLPMRDFTTGWCNVSTLANTSLSWDCHVEYNIATQLPGHAKTWNVTWAGGNKAQPDGTYQFAIGADNASVPLGKFSAFLQDNLFMPDVAEEHSHDIVALLPNVNGTTDWDCTPHEKMNPIQKKLPSCWVSMMQQPSWNMVLWQINICNKGFVQKGFEDRCKLTPGAQAYFEKREAMKVSV